MNSIVKQYIILCIQENMLYDITSAEDFPSTLSEIYYNKEKERNQFLKDNKDKLGCEYVDVCLRVSYNDLYDSTYNVENEIIKEFTEVEGDSCGEVLRLYANGEKINEISQYLFSRGVDENNMDIYALDSPKIFGISNWIDAKDVAKEYNIEVPNPLDDNKEVQKIVNQLNEINNEIEKLQLKKQELLNK